MYRISLKLLTVLFIGQRNYISLHEIWVYSFGQCKIVENIVISRDESQ